MNTNKLTRTAHRSAGGQKKTERVATQAAARRAASRKRAAQAAPE